MTDGYDPGDEYAGEHNESEWHDSNDGFVEDGNMTDGYDPGDEYAGEHNESEWHDSNDSNDGFVEDGNMTDGYDPGICRRDESDGTTPMMDL